MNTPVTRPSGRPRGTQLYHKNQVYIPSSCSGAAEQTASLRRQIALLDERLAADIAEVEAAEFANGAILTLSIVKETCMSFVSLAAALTPHNPGTAIVKGLAETGMAVTEFRTGQISGAAATHKAVDGVIGAGGGIAEKIGAGGLATKAFEHVASTWNDLARIVTSDGKEASNMGTKIAHSNADLLIETAESGLKSAGHGKTATGLKGLGIVKNVSVEANAYHGALTAAMEEYFRNETAWNERKAQIRADHRKTVQKLKQQLEQALKDLEACMSPPDAPVSMGGLT